jgi:hypothetical protein
MSTIGTGVDLQTYILIGTNTFPYDEMMQVILCVQAAWHSTQALNPSTNSGHEEVSINLFSS